MAQGYTNAVRGVLALMPIATVTGHSQVRDIERVMDGDHIASLRPVPGSERSSLTLTFENGKTLEVRVSNDDHERVCAAYTASEFGKDHSLRAAWQRWTEPEKRAWLRGWEPALKDEPFTAEERDRAFDRIEALLSEKEIDRWTWPEATRYPVVSVQVTSDGRLRFEPSDDCYAIEMSPAEAREVARLILARAKQQ